MRHTLLQTVNITMQLMFIVNRQSAIRGQLHRRHAQLAAKDYILFTGYTSACLETGTQTQQIVSFFYNDAIHDSADKR